MTKTFLILQCVFFLFFSFFSHFFPNFVSKADSIKFFSFSCYDGKCSAFICHIAQLGQIQDKIDKKAMSKMMKGLRKNIAKTMSENG